MTEYKAIKITAEDYDSLKRYMHLGFQDTMTEAFHSAISTALFEEYGEGTPKPSRSQAIISDLTTRAQVNAEERDQALNLLHMTVPELHQMTAKGVKDNVSHAKRDNKRKTKA